MFIDLESMIIVTKISNLCLKGCFNFSYFYEGLSVSFKIKMKDIYAVF